jgi:hypothetical protein
MKHKGKWSKLYLNKVRTEKQRMQETQTDNCTQMFEWQDCTATQSKRIVFYLISQKILQNDVSDMF